MPSTLPPVQQLLVEGKNDRHVIWALCKYYNLPKTFSVETLNEEEGGVERLIRTIPVRLKRANLVSLGIVVDADDDIGSRWRALRNQLIQSDYTAIPTNPQRKGIVVSQPSKPRIGVWIMPNNQLSGSLEDFTRMLIAPEDPLEDYARQIISEIEKQKLNRYRPSYRSKAFIHTWLAWQKSPGMPLGQAITAKALDPESPIAQEFMNWLQRLFTVP